MLKEKIKWFWFIFGVNKKVVKLNIICKISIRLLTLLEKKIQLKFKNYNNKFNQIKQFKLKYRKNKRMLKNKNKISKLSKKIKMKIEYKNNK